MAKMQEDQAILREKERRANLITNMSRYIGDANGQPYLNNNAEATYYAEQYDYDF